MSGCVVVSHPPVTGRSGNLPRNSLKARNRNVSHDVPCQDKCTFKYENPSEVKLRRGSDTLAIDR